MKVKQFLMRFLIHLGFMIGVSLIGLKIGFPKTTLNKLILVEHDFIWISILAALITTVMGHFIGNR